MEEKKEREGSNTWRDKGRQSWSTLALALWLAHKAQAAPLPVSFFLSVLSLPPLGLRFWDGFLRLCIEFDWERRPHPPCALWAFQFLVNSILRVLVFGLNFNSGMNSFVARDRSSS